MRVSLFHEHHFLAPVADDVAPETGAIGPAGMGGILRFARKFGQPAAVVFLDVRVAAEAAAAGRPQLLTAQVAVPPHALVGIRVGSAVQQAALDVVAVGHHGVDFIAKAGGIYVHALATSHIIDRGEVPFLEVPARGRIVNHLS